MREVAIAGASARIDDMVVDVADQLVYWIETSTTANTTVIQKIAAGAISGTGTLAYSMAMNENPAELRLVGQELFWAGNGRFLHGPVMSAGTTPTPVPSGPIVSYQVFGVDSSRFYWAAGGAQLNYQPLPSTSSFPLATSSGNISWIEPDADPSGDVYFLTTNGGPSIFRTTKLTMATPVAVASLTSGFGRILITNKHVYWSDPVSVTNPCTGSVNLNRKSLPNTPEAPETIATVTGCPLLAQDASAIYWNDGPSIYRMVEP